MTADVLVLHNNLKQCVAQEKVDIGLSSRFLELCPDETNRRTLAQLGLPAVLEPLLHLAVYADAGDLVMLLLDKYGVDVDQPGKFRCWNRLGIRNTITPLWLAAALNRLDIMKTLLQRGACCAYADEFRRTALHAAAQHGHSGAVELLLDNGADANATDNNGFFSIHEIFTLTDGS